MQFKGQIINYVDDTSICYSAKSKEELMNYVEHDIKKSKLVAPI